MQNLKKTIDIINQQRDIITAVSHSGKKIKFLTNAPYPLKRACTIDLSEPETIAWLEELQAEEVLWDVGANMGIFTLYASVVRGMQVYSFEPEASNFALLSKNIQVNDVIDQVTAICTGLSDQNGIQTLYKYCDFESSGINSVGKEVDAHLKPKKSLSKQKVTTYTGDYLIHNEGFKAPNHIKIDVDGIEHLIVNGLENNLQSKVDSVLVELNLNLPEHREVVATLSEMGFKTNPTLTEMCRIKTGYWKDMVNMIFSRDNDFLEKVTNRYLEFVTNSPDYKDYQKALEERRDHEYYESVNTTEVEFLERK
tara:strand:- start:12427 stop:13356 length:930 start_codon:yes stop_codon:yes gene_type:complete